MEHYIIVDVDSDVNFEGYNGDYIAPHASMKAEVYCHHRPAFQKSES